MRSSWARYAPNLIEEEEEEGEEEEIEDMVDYSLTHHMTAANEQKMRK